MKKPGLFILIGLMLVLSGCLELGFYVSDVPITPVKKAKIDKRLPGEWEKVLNEENAEQDNSPEWLKIIQFNDGEYVFTAPEGDGCSVIRAFGSKVKDKLFLNMQPLDEDERQFILCEYTVSPDGQLSLKLVANKLFADKKIKSSKKLYKFLKKHLDNPDLYAKETIIFEKK